MSVLADEVFEWRPYYLPQLYLGFYQLPSLSIFIQSEKDTGIYKYTEYLEWDPQQNAYVGETQHALEQRRKAIRRYSDRVVGGKNKTSNVQFSRKQEISCLQSAVSSWEDTSVAADSDIDVSKINTLKFDKVVSELIRNKNQRKLQKKTYVPTRHSLIQRKDNLTPIKSVAIKATDSRKYESSISLDARQTQICGTINDEEWMHSDVNNRSTPGCENLVTPKKLKGLGLNVQQQIANAHKYGYFVDTEQILSEISSLNTEGIIRDLSLSIEEYFDCGYDSPSSTTTCGTPGKHDHPRYLETGIEISFPPFPVTYRIIFGLIALRRVVLIPWYTKNIVDVLERWMTLFDHKRLVRGVRGRSKRSREANEFFVYYRNNVATAVDMSGYLAIVSELITLLFILKVCPENAKVAKTQEISGTYIYGTDSNSKFKLIDKVVKENCSLRLIPIALDFQQGERFQEIRFNEEEASNFVREFQSLLIPDIAIVAASFRMFKTTTATILQAISKDDRYCDAVAQISQLIHSSDTKTLSSARHFLVRLYDMSYDAIYSVICVCVSQLGTLFKKNELLAINVCLMLFPLIHPWNVQLALFGSSELTVSDKDEATNGSEVQAFNTWKSSAYLKFYNYLTKLMKAEESLVGQSCDTIHSFLHTALYLHHSIATEEGFQQVTHNMDRPQSLPNLEPKVSFNHAAEMRSQQRYSIAVSNRQHPNLMSSQGYLSSAKRLLKTSEKYLYNPLYSARECVKYDYFEGVVLAIDKWLTESINSNCNLRNHVVHSDLTEIFDTLGAATRALLKDWTTYANNTHVELTSWKNESIFHSMLTCAWIVCAAAAKSTEENLDSNYLPSTVRKFTTWLDPLLSEVEECIQAIVEKEGYEVLDHFAIAVVDSLATVLGKHLGSRSKTEELSFFKTRIRPSNDVELTKECVNGLLDGIPVVADHLSMIFFRHIAPWYQ